MKTTNGKKPTKTFAATVGRALRRAGQAARKTARAHGTPIYIWQDGKKQGWMEESTLEYFNLDSQYWLSGIGSDHS